ncbi:DNA-binding PadR family transcriptional regulator [Dongia mobilis]|uniref:DNA-binding PadR family transcriptional regulator n=2 Tax=Dongia mobilis TaxID=578943 RepID=A0A4R6WFN1_9PROT|nr:DNA-binding PadR family transcriptional regulator [Dongia mobilis]
MFFKQLHKRCEERHARGDWGMGGRWNREHGFGKGFGGRHRHHGGGRVFDHGDLRLVILHLISEKPRYGYEVIKAIEEKVAGAYTPSPGVVYPTLTLLEETGLATVSEVEGNKKLYAVTESGKSHLAENRVTVEGILRRIEETHAAHGGGPSPQIIRAMENFKMALRLRLSQGKLSEEQNRSITAALDEAARKIEQA